MKIPCKKERTKRSTVNTCWSWLNCFLFLIWGNFANVYIVMTVTIIINGWDLNAKFKYNPVQFVLWVTQKGHFTQHNPNSIKFNKIYFSLMIKLTYLTMTCICNNIFAFCFQFMFFFYLSFYITSSIRATNCDCVSSSWLGA